MFVLYLLLSMAIGYLSGSLNWAIIVTKIVAGKDIRDMGNGNAGSANAGRCLNKGWGTLVLFLDLFKAIGPVILARWLFFRGDGYAGFLPLFVTGMAAILGHCKPLYFGFRGGRGAAAGMAVFLFFIPVELLITQLISFLLVNIFFRKEKYSVGRWTSVFFVLLVPFLTLALNYLFEIPLFAHLTFGGHPWFILTGVFATSLFLLFINYPFLKKATDYLVHKKPPED